MSGIALSSNQSAAWKYWWKRARPYHRNLIVTASLILFGSLCFMTPPIMTKYILERVLPQHNWGLLLIVCLCTVVVPILGSVVIAIETYALRFVLHLAGQGKAELLDGFQHRSISWMQQHKPGDLMTRTLDDSDHVVQFVDNQIWWMLWLLITITVGSVVLLFLHPGLALLILILWALHAVLMTCLGSQVKRRAAETARQTSRVTETMREVLSAASFIKATGREDQAIGALDIALQRDLHVNRRNIITNHAAEFISVFLGSCFLAILYFAGGRLVVQGQMTIGSLVAFAAVYNWLRPFGIAFFETYFAAKKASPAIDRIAEVASPAQIRSGPCPPGDACDIEAIGLSFHHSGGQPVIRDVSFRIPAGSVVSIVGARGSGKSTLTDLLLGLQSPSSGMITIGGIPLSLIDERWLRRHLLCITQEVLLRSGTILDNIVYGSDETDFSAICQAIRLAELEDWIAQLPEGWHTPVGEQGLALSGGERQRISIARALLRKPAILVLDEATSALDLRTEQRLLEQLTRRLRGTTLIFVTHRPAITRMSDQRFVMRNGKLHQSDLELELSGTGA